MSQALAQKFCTISHLILTAESQFQFICGRRLRRREINSLIAYHPASKCMPAFESSVLPIVPGSLLFSFGSTHPGSLLRQRQPWHLAAQPQGGDRLGLWQAEYGEPQQQLSWFACGCLVHTQCQCVCCKPWAFSPSSCSWRNQVTGSLWRAIQAKPDLRNTFIFQHKGKKVSSHCSCSRHFAEGIHRSSAESRKKSHLDPLLWHCLSACRTQIPACQGKHEKVEADVVWSLQTEQELGKAGQFLQLKHYL